MFENCRSNPSEVLLEKGILKIHQDIRWNKYFNQCKDLRLSFKTSDERRKMFENCRSNPSEALLEKGILKICIRFTGEHTCRLGMLLKLVMLLYSVVDLNEIVWDKSFKISNELNVAILVSLISNHFLHWIFTKVASCMKYGLCACMLAFVWN